MSCPPPTDARPYLLDTDDEELVRLGIQHRLWGDAAHRAWRRARIAPAMRVLDVGCGPGYASFDLAQLVGDSGAVVGVDASTRFIAHARAHTERLGITNTAFVEGNVEALSEVLDQLGEEGTGFDAAWTRWVPCFLEHPERLVEGIAACIRPGGRVAIHDYFNYQAITAAPRLASFEPVVAAIRRSWAESGGDTDVMGSMPGMLVRHGFRVVHLQAHQRVARPGDPMWQWPTTFFASYLPKLVETGHLARSDADAFMDQWQQITERYAGSPDSSEAFFNPPPVYEVIAERL